MRRPGAGDTGPSLLLLPCFCAIDVHNVAPCCYCTDMPPGGRTKNSSATRSPRKDSRTKDVPLLHRARLLADRGKTQELARLAPRVKEASISERPLLASMVGDALIDSLRCGEALKLYARVLRQTRVPEHRAVLLLGRARAHHELFDVDRGLEQVAQARKLLGARTSPGLLALMLNIRAALLSSTGKQQQAEQLCLEAMELCQGGPETAELAVESLVIHALIALRRGKLEQAHQRVRLAVERSDHSMGTLRADALRTEAVINANRSEFLMAIFSCRQALRIYTDHQSLRGRFKGCLSLGISYLTMGELDHAELFFHKCRDLALSGSDKAPRSLAHSRLGHVALARGEPADALDFYRQDSELNARLNNPVSKGHPELNMGQALLDSGEFREAVRPLKRALTFFSAVDDPVGQVRVHLALARAGSSAAATLNRPRFGQRDAEHHLWQARKLVDPDRRLDLRCRCDATEGLVLAARGEVQEAMARFRAGLATMERLEEVAEATHSTFRMGAMLAATGIKGLAVERYLDALRSAETHQFRGLCQQLLRRLDALDENAVVDRSLRFGARRLSGKELLRHKVRPEDLLGSSPPVVQVRKQINQVGPTDVPVLVTGESGTGKELVARAIHFTSSAHSVQPVVLNCGAIPEGLVESELFGHARGAFTGADRSHMGCFERANHGTVFLDEIGDLPLDAQVKLLRFLSTGEVRKVGETKPVHVDVRVIAATHRDLWQLVEQQLFRQDLYYRLNIFNIRTVPLRHMRDDIPALARHFLTTDPLALERDIERIHPRAMAALKRYSWPGNVRELENAIRRACVVCGGPALLRDHLPRAVVHGPRTITSGRPLTLKEKEQEYVRQVLARCDGNRTRAARQLGIHRNTLARKLGE